MFTLNFFLVTIILFQLVTCRRFLVLKTKRCGFWSDKENIYFLRENENDFIGIKDIKLKLTLSKKWVFEQDGTEYLFINSESGALPLDEKTWTTADQSAKLNIQIEDLSLLSSIMHSMSM